MTANVIEILKAARVIGTFFAALSLIILGFKFVFSSGQDDASLIKVGRNILVALALLWMIAPIFKLGKSIANGYAWKPEVSDAGFLSDSRTLVEDASSTTNPNDDN